MRVHFFLFRNLCLCCLMFVCTRVSDAPQVICGELKGADDKNSLTILNHLASAVRLYLLYQSVSTHPSVVSLFVIDFFRLFLFFMVHSLPVFLLDRTVTKCKLKLLKKQLQWRSVCPSLIVIDDGCLFCGFLLMLLFVLL